VHEAPRVAPHLPTDKTSVPETPTPISQSLCFGGVQAVYTHDARETGCPMRFGLFLPPQANAGPVPLLYWLSGLTCTEENFIVKAGAQRVAAELGLAIVVPDTSPRGLDYPGERDSYDFGVRLRFDHLESPLKIDRSDQLQGGKLSVADVPRPTARSRSFFDRTKAARPRS